MKMTQFGLATFLALSFAVLAGARGSVNGGPEVPRQSNPPVSEPNAPPSLPTGTGMVGTLSTKLDTRHSKVGDPVKVEVIQDVLEGDRVALSKGSYVAGRVTDVCAYSRKVSNARLEIVFDTIFSKDGARVSTYLVVYAIAARRDDASDNMQDSRPMAASAQSPRVGSEGGGPAGGALKPDSKGIFNLDGFRLTPMARDNPPTSLFHSESQDILLDKGTEVVLVAEGKNNLSGR